MRTPDTPLKNLRDGYQSAKVIRGKMDPKKKSRSKKSCIFDLTKFIINTYRICYISIEECMTIDKKVHQVAIKKLRIVRRHYKCYRLTFTISIND